MPGGFSGGSVIQPGSQHKLIPPASAPNPNKDNPKLDGPRVIGPTAPDPNAIDKESFPDNRYR
jgi:hypothetical protein